MSVAVFPLPPPRFELISSGQFPSYVAPSKASMHRQVDSCFKVKGTGQRIRCPALGASKIMAIMGWGAW